MPRHASMSVKHRQHRFRPVRHSFACRFILFVSFLFSSHFSPLPRAPPLQARTPREQEELLRRAKNRRDNRSVALTLAFSQELMPFQFGEFELERDELRERR